MKKKIHIVLFAEINIKYQNYYLTKWQRFFTLEKIKFSIHLWDGIRQDSMDIVNNYGWQIKSQQTY